MDGFMEGGLPCPQPSLIMPTIGVMSITSIIPYITIIITSIISFIIPIPPASSKPPPVPVARVPTLPIESLLTLTLGCSCHFLLSDTF